jgi:DNA-binding MarR family transcriptional regulator
VDTSAEAADAEQELAVDVVAGLERLIRLFRALASPAELSLTAAATLSTLDRSGPSRVTSLAAREGITQPAMTQLISRLADAGLLSRAADPGDGRAVQVCITSEGRALLARRRAARAQRLAGMLGQLSPADRAALAAALPAIGALTSLQPEDRPLAAPRAP